MTNEKEHLGIWIDVRIKEALRREAEQQGLRMSTLARTILMQWYRAQDNHKSEQEEPCTR